MEYEWRPVPGYEGIYEIRQGMAGGCVRRVTSLARTYHGRELRSIDGSGYPRATLSKPGEKPKTARLHVLIMEVFGPEKPFDDAIVRHLNDIKLHNVVDNLEWGTKSDNLRDAYQNGLRVSVIQRRWETS